MSRFSIILIWQNLVLYASIHCFNFLEDINSNNNDIISKRIDLLYVSHPHPYTHTHAHTHTNTNTHTHTHTDTLEDYNLHGA